MTSVMGYVVRGQGQAQRIAGYLWLLPYAQAAQRSADLSMIAGRAKEMFSVGILSLSFIQIENSLSEFSSSPVLMATCAK